MLAAIRRSMNLTVKPLIAFNLASHHEMAVPGADRLDVASKLDFGKRADILSQFWSGLVYFKVIIRWIEFSPLMKWLLMDKK